MNQRISRAALNLGIADLIAQRATCQRAKVGCVITVNRRIVSTGYNGPLFRCECDVSEPCTKAIHAEANAIAAAAKLGVPLMGGVLYCNYSPCSTCANLIIQAGIKRVIYREAYRDTNPILFMEANGIHVHKFNPELDSYDEQN